MVLDNFEQVARLARQTLGTWLDRARDAQFVVTSREVLGLPGGDRADGQHYDAVQERPDDRAESPRLHDVGDTRIRHHLLDDLERVVRRAQ